MGTGTYLLSVIDAVARTVAQEQGDGAVGPQLRGLFGRLIGFERQAGPYAVAQMRTHHALKEAARLAPTTAEASDPDRRRGLLRKPSP